MVNAFVLELTHWLMLVDYISAQTFKPYNNMQIEHSKLFTCIGRIKKLNEKVWI